MLEACPEPDILINNAGGPPPGDFKDFSMDDWRQAVESNMITPIALIHATVYGMMDRGFGQDRQYHQLLRQGTDCLTRAFERSPRRV